MAVACGCNKFKPCSIYSHLEGWLVGLFLGIFKDVRLFTNTQKWQYWHERFHDVKTKKSEPRCYPLLKSEITWTNLFNHGFLVFGFTNVLCKWMFVV